MSLSTIFQLYRGSHYHIYPPALLNDSQTSIKRTSFRQRKKWSYNKRVKVFNATFNNISVISWRSVLLVEETGVPGENY
jgi:hypothetical protein